MRFPAVVIITTTETFAQIYVIWHMGKNWIGFEVTWFKFFFDILFVWESDISAKMTRSINGKELYIYGPNWLYAIRSVAAHSFSLLFWNLASFKL